MRLTLRRLDKVGNHQGETTEIPTRGKDEASLRNWCMMWMLASRPCQIEVSHRAGRLYFTEFPPRENDPAADAANLYLKLVEYVFGRLLAPHVPASGIYAVEVIYDPPTP